MARRHGRVARATLPLRNIRGRTSDRLSRPLVAPKSDEVGSRMEAGEPWTEHSSIQFNTLEPPGIEYKSIQINTKKEFFRAGREIGGCRQIFFSSHLGPKTVDCLSRRPVAPKRSADGSGAKAETRRPTGAPERAPVGLETRSFLHFSTKFYTKK